MKCRVCGYELAGDRSYCPMCGTKVYEQPKVNMPSNTEIAWNTKDFPKPKQLEDIDMNWGNGFKSFMAKDASEGFVSMEKEVEKEKQAVNQEGFSSNTSGIDPFELPSQMKAQTNTAYESPKTQSVSGFDAWKMPPQEEPQMPLWYTQNFTATGVMKTGPAFPITQSGATAPMPNVPPMQNEQDARVAAALSASMPDATIQYVKVDAPKPVYKTDYEAYKPDYEAIPPQAQKSAEKFNTFVAKNEEFQALLDREYARIHKERQNDVSPIPSAKTSNLFVAEPRVKAQDIFDFEKSLFGEEPEEKQVKQSAPLFTPPTFKDDFKLPSRKEETPVKAFDKPVKAYEVPEKSFEQPVKTFSYDSDTTDLNLDELISDPLNPRFNIDTIEMTIKQLELEEEKEEQERQNRQSRLEAMKAAREAYFKFLDENNNGIPDYLEKDFTPIPLEKPEQVEETKFEPANFKEFESFNESDDDMKTWSKKSNTIEMNEDSLRYSDEHADEDSTKLPDELVGLYSDDDEDYDEDEEPKRKHGFLKFLFVLVLVVGILEGAILGLQHFLPNAPITTQATEMQAAVVDAFTSIYSSISD